VPRFSRGVFIFSGSRVAFRRAERARDGTREGNAFRFVDFVPFFCESPSAFLFSEEEKHG
jgi:hypothetical protein